MLLNSVIEKICSSGIGYRGEKFYIPALYFADDGLLLAESIRDMERLIDVTIEASRKCGLGINEDKSFCIIYGAPGATPPSIRGMKVVSDIKYLGIRVSSQRDCYANHRKEKVLQGRTVRSILIQYIDEISRFHISRPQTTTKFGP